MNRRIFWGLLPVLAVIACDEPEPSNLEKLAAEAQVEAEKALDDAKPASATEEPSSTAPSETKQDDEPPTAVAAGPKHDLNLALVEGTKYRVTTIGMTSFAMVGQPAGFAREEDIELDNCSGEGPKRQCTVTNRTRNFDAEAPLGSPMIKGEEAIKDLVTSHTMAATGERLGETTVEGPAAQTGLPQAEILANSHRLHCLSFPNGPVAVGEGWNSECDIRIGGQLQHHVVQWKLGKVEEDEDLGTKAELHFAGSITTPHPSDATRERSGAVAGVLYFLASRGEPHMLRQRISLQSPVSGNQRTTIDMRVQFAKLSDDGKTVVRVDGKPFPPAEAPTMPADPGAAAKAATAANGGN